MVRADPVSCLDWLGRPPWGVDLVREMFRAVLVKLGVGRTYLSLAFYKFFFFICLYRYSHLFHGFQTLHFRMIVSMNI